MSTFACLAIPLVINTKSAALPPNVIAKHTKVDVIWFAGRNPTSVAQNLKATTLTYLAI